MLFVFSKLVHYMFYFYISLIDKWYTPIYVYMDMNNICIYMSIYIFIHNFTVVVGTLVSLIWLDY